QQEEEQPAKLSAKRTGGEVELPHIGDIGGGRTGSGRPLVVEPPGETGEALGLEEDGDGGGTEGVAFVVEGAADVVDGEVLLAQGDDALAEAILLGSGLGSFGGCEE